MTYTGPLPRPIPVIEAQSERRLVERDPKTGALKDVGVWLEGVKTPGKRTVKIPPYMDQQSYFFVPHVLAVEAGVEVEFANSDSCNHGVRASNSDARNSFNLITPPGRSLKLRFHAAKDPVKIDCPLHAPMAAWVFVFDHVYYAVTGTDGKFTLPPVPPGTYTLRVLHPSGGMSHKRTVTVKAGEKQNLKIDFGKDDLKVK